MNANQAFCVAIAVLLLQMMNIQQQQMFAFLLLYQRWANEYREMLNIAFLPRSSARLCFPIAHVDQPKGLSELFTPRSSICRTVFYFSEMHPPALPHPAHR